MLEPKLKSLKIEQIEFKLTPREPPNSFYNFKTRIEGSLQMGKTFYTHYFLHNLLYMLLKPMKQIIAASFVTLISFVKVEVTFLDQILVINCHRKHWSNAAFLFLVKFSPDLGLQILI